MTLTDAPRGTDTAHPLDMTTTDDVDQVREVLAEAGLLTEQTRWAFFLPEEPDKARVLAHQPGAEVDRRFRVALLQLDTGRSQDVLVSSTHRRVDSVRELDPATDGQPPIIDTEFEAVEEILLADDTWCAALRRRGLEPEKVRALPLSAGVFGIPDEVGRRMVRVFGFRQDSEADHIWAHPVDGLVAYVDLTARTATQVIEHQDFPVPDEPANYNNPDEVGPQREGIKPIEITQPEGASFSVRGNRVQWAGWDLRIGFNEREGLTLHQVSFAERPILYRASIAEMVVTYADPSPSRFWQDFFDCGEYMFARYTNSLELGCDCLGEIHYLDAVIADDLGHPKTIRNAICLHEEDFGILWKHTDMFTGAAETRRQRRLVVSFFLPIGNYDYGFYWYLYLDGRIEFEVKATGIVFPAGYPEGGSPYTVEVAPGVGAPYHQHMFSARLDMMVDGPHNAVDEVEATRVPVGPDNPYGNAFTMQRTRLASEAGAKRLADNAKGRTWHILNPDKHNRFGQPVSYVLRPEGQPVLLADESAPIRARAGFATRHLWVTRYDPAQRYSAGDFVNQHPGGAGLPEWTAADRTVDGEDIVIWHTFGLTHFPRPEDWPVMPVEYAGFSLSPVGFFDRNPALDVPPPSGHCGHQDAASGNGHAGNGHVD